jgi:fatty-acyl-CoA synthase
MSGWNYADVFEAIAAAIPDAPCQLQGERVVSWGEFDRRANALAADLLAAGLQRQSKVAAYLYNAPEYLEVYTAAFKAGLVPVNTNFRYGATELRYLWDDADAEAVVFHSSFAPIAEQLRAELPRVRRWYAVSDGADGAPVPDWAVPYAQLVESGAPRAIAPWGRSGDDLMLLYTGGTTGLPKGVMWRQDDVFHLLGRGGHRGYGVEPVDSLEQLAARLRAPRAAVLPACPLMHGTGAFSALIAMAMGGAVVLLEGRRFDAAELWRTAGRRRVFCIALVGDAFARPMLAELDANPGGYDLSSVKLLLAHLPDAMLLDSYGSSEAIGLGASVSTRGSRGRSGSFVAGHRALVLGGDDRPLAPGSPEIGRVAIRGHVPLGYYKDPAKSARTFVERDGVRYAIPGDYARIEADGSIALLGRGSLCINTGGEKVFPEEVEQALKRHPAVADAACVGLPDARFGEVVCALVELEREAPFDERALTESVKVQLAAYKAPRHVLRVDSLARAPNGKLDYRALRALARERLGR